MFVKRNHALLVGQAYQRFDFEAKLEHTSPVDVLLHNTIETDYLDHIVVTQKYRVLVYLSDVNNVELVVYYFLEQKIKRFDISQSYLIGPTKILIKFFARFFNFKIYINKDKIVSF
jgi:hypothetical protein